MLMVKFFSCLNMTNSSNTGHRDMSTAILIRIDQSGKGDFTKIQDAIDSVPLSNSELVFIRVKPGTYREIIVVPSEKPFITLSGTQASTTVITWIHGMTMEICFLTLQQSTYQLPILIAFYGCRIISYQDTLLDDPVDTTTKSVTLKELLISHLEMQPLFSKGAIFIQFRTEMEPSLHKGESFRLRILALCS
ncbi:pectinesterase 11 [Olea europaea subsp. europaea]|uniref:Pectinesterase n=1 Tax=Olea europaea subsp. europaea TaxID=158383 RepID=A0A8S0S9X3_OLEEU|nr:pectinesterase 11 [Olea europaea subsp. europaea]